MEARTITMKNCLIMFIFLLFAIFVSILTEQTENVRPNTVLLAQQNNSKTFSVGPEIGR